MSGKEALFAWVQEALEPLGAVTMRSMMGGATLYLDGTVFAIIADDEIWFKADAQSDGVWDDQGCDRFTFTMGDGRSGSMNYRRGPTDVYDDPDEMRRWARLALEAGLRAPPRKAKKKKSG